LKSRPVPRDTRTVFAALEIASGGSLSNFSGISGNIAFLFRAKIIFTLELKYMTVEF
jgi:hypothetical protein